MTLAATVKNKKKKTLCDLCAFCDLFSDEDLLQCVQTSLGRLFPAFAGSRNEEPVVVDTNRVTADLVDAVTFPLVRRGGHVLLPVQIICRLFADLSLHATIASRCNSGLWFGGRGLLLLLLTGPPAAGFDLAGDLLSGQSVWLPLIIFELLRLLIRR